MLIVKDSPKNNLFYSMQKKSTYGCLGSKNIVNSIFNGFFKPNFTRNNGLSDIFREPKISKICYEVTF